MDTHKKIGAQILIGLGTLLIIGPLVLLLIPPVAHAIGDLFMVFGLVLSPLGALCVVIGEIFVWRRIRDSRRSGVPDAIKELKVFATIGICTLLIYIGLPFVRSFIFEIMERKLVREQFLNDPSVCTLRYSEKEGKDSPVLRSTAEHMKQVGCPEVLFVAQEAQGVATKENIVPLIEPNSTPYFLVTPTQAMQLQAHQIVVPSSSLFVVTNMEKHVLATFPVTKKDMILDLTGRAESGEQVIVTLVEDKNQDGVYQKDTDTAYPDPELGDLHRTTVVIQ